MTDKTDPSVTVLSTLLRLEKRVRLAESVAELRFIAVNETYALVPYRTGIWGDSDQGVLAISGTSELSQEAPFLRWLNRLIKYLCKQNFQQPTQISAEQLPADLAGEWRNWLPRYLLVAPLSEPDRDQPLALLLLSRERPSSEAEIVLLQEWLAILASHYASKRLQRQRRRFGGTAVKTARQRKVLGFALIVLLLAAAVFIKIPLTVLASANLVPKDPYLVRAPIAGVIDQVLVSHNQAVTAGTPLLSFDGRALSSELAIAQTELDASRARYRQVAQQALLDPSAKAKLAVIQAELEMQSQHTVYLRSQLERSSYVAPVSGRVIWERASDWEGRAVQLGERILQLVDPTENEIEAWISPEDLIQLETGQSVLFIPAASPDLALNAELISLAKAPTRRPNGRFAYQAIAQPIAGQRLPTVGSQGTLKLKGASVPLGYALLRRPLSLLRQWF